MSDEEPHKIEDNEPQGHQTTTVVTVKQSPKIKTATVIVRVGFDDNLKEFHLWDYLFDIETEKFALDTTSDYKNRIQYYEITADRFAIRKFKRWMIKKGITFKVKLDK
tara:strand:- start:629 stop:952 length:324 start_codon:yes stop_codon:yes gene_type:complete